MSNADSKEPSAPPEGFPEAETFGGPIQASALNTDQGPAKPRVELASEPWHRIVTRCAREVRALESDPAALERIVRAFRSALRTRRKPGTKPDQATVRAAHLYVRGMEAWESGAHKVSLNRYQRGLWRQIQHEVLPGFPAMDKYERLARTSNLRRNVKAYLIRRGIKWSNGIRVTTRKRRRKQAIVPMVADQSKSKRAAEEQDARSTPGDEGQGSPVPK